MRSDPEFEYVQEELLRLGVVPDPPKDGKPAHWFFTDLHDVVREPRPNAETVAFLRAAELRSTSTSAGREAWGTRVSGGEGVRRWRRKARPGLVGRRS